MKRELKVIIVGSTGMVGSLVLKNCLLSKKINKVISLNRNSSEIKNPKLTEIITQNFEDYSDHALLFKDVDIGFFCIGVYSNQTTKEQFKKTSMNYAVKFADAIKDGNPKGRLCLLSSAGADRTEKSKFDFALYKGMAENEISKLNLDFYTFRPQYIYPVISRREPSIIYKILRIIYPIIKILGNKFSIKSTDLAKVMVKVGIYGANKKILENEDILNLV